MSQLLKTPSAISGMRDQTKIRLLIYVHNQAAHVPLTALMAPLHTKIVELENRIKQLENV